MSDGSGGAGWWQASDGKWYPPERHADPEWRSRHAAPEPASAASPDPAPEPLPMPLPEPVPTVEVIRGDKRAQEVIK